MYFFLYSNVCVPPDEVNEEPNQEKDKDENENQDKEEDIGVDNDEEKDEDKGADNDKDEEEDKGTVWGVCFHPFTSNSWRYTRCQSHIFTPN